MGTEAAKRSVLRSGRMPMGRLEFGTKKAVIKMCPAGQFQRLGVTSKLAEWTTAFVM